MPIDELIELREQVDRIVTERIGAEKRVLLGKLDAIRKFEARKQGPSTPLKTKAAPNKKPRAKAAPKYRNPITGETWAGRGLQPRWLRKSLEAGHDLKEFLIQQR
jgi:DNA-binding protein H-NS